VGAAVDKAHAAEQAIADIEAELRAEVLAIDAEWQAKVTATGTLEIPLERSDVTVADLRLVWVPLPQEAGHQNA
jgi:hypothetical protein